MPLDQLLEAFNAGELSPRLVGRASFNRYQFGAAELRNFIVMVQGGIKRRGGTRHVTSAIDHDTHGRLMPFEVGTIQAYVVEHGVGFTRFFRNKGRIVADDTNAEIQNETFDSGIAGWSDESTGAASIDFAEFYEALALVGASGETAHAEQAVSINAQSVGNLHVIRFSTGGAPGDKVTLRIGTTSNGDELVEDIEFETGFHCYEFTPTTATFYVQFLHTKAKTLTVDSVHIIDDAAVEILNPWLTSTQLHNLQWGQTTDTAYLVDGEERIMKLKRLGHHSWSLAYALFADGPYMPISENEFTTTTLASSSGSVGALGVVITASQTDDINDGKGFLASDVGRLIRIKNGSNWAYCIITEFNTNLTVEADALGSIGLPTSPTTSWRLGAWSDTTGWPRAVTFFDQRLLFGGTTKFPRTFWGSESEGLINSFAESDPDETVTDAHAYTYTLGSGKNDAILWMAAERNLLIGTPGGVFAVGSSGAALTNSDIQTRRHITSRTRAVPPVEAHGRLLFVQRRGRKVLEAQFSFEVEKFVDDDLTVLANHITKSGIHEMVFSEEPDSMVWCARNDGVAATLTYEPNQEVVGWGRQIVGGSHASGSPIIESLCAIPGEEDEPDQVWMIVVRTIDGDTRRYIEYVTEVVEPDMNDVALKDSAFMDSSLVYEGVPVQTLTGFTHLVGETVKLLVNGKLHPDKTVDANGEVTLDYLPEGAAMTAIGGLGYTHYWHSLKFAQADQLGVWLARFKGMTELTAMLLNSLQLEIALADGNTVVTEYLKADEFVQIEDPQEDPLSLFTGDLRMQVPQEKIRDMRLVISGDEPLPLTLVGLVPTLDVEPD